MALINCTECGNEVSDKASACPKCGAPIALYPQTQHLTASPTKAVTFTPASTVALVGAGIFIVFLVILVATKGGSPGDQSSSTAEARDRRAVEYCEERYKEMNADRQYTPDVLSFHSQTCRQMREDFIAKWGSVP